MNAKASTTIVALPRAVMKQCKVRNTVAPINALRGRYQTVLHSRIESIY